MFALNKFKLLLFSLLVLLFYFSELQAQNKTLSKYGIREAGMKAYLVSGAKVDVFVMQGTTKSRSASHSLFKRYKHLTSYTTDKNGNLNIKFSKGVIIPIRGELLLKITTLKGLTYKKQNGNNVILRKRPGRTKYMAKKKITVKYSIKGNTMRAYCTSNGGPYAQSLITLDDYSISKDNNTITLKVPVTLKFTLIYVAFLKYALKGGFAVSGRSGT